MTDIQDFQKNLWIDESGKGVGKPIKTYSKAEKTLRKWNDYSLTFGAISLFLSFGVGFYGIFLVTQARRGAETAPFVFACAFSIFCASLATFWWIALLDMATEASKNLREANEHLRKLAEEKPS